MCARDMSHDNPQFIELVEPISLKEVNVDWKFEKWNGNVPNTLTTILKISRRYKLRAKSEWRQICARDMSHDNPQFIIFVEPISLKEVNAAISCLKKRKAYS